MIRIYRNRINGSFIIWTDYEKCTYYDYTKTEAIRKFKQDNNVRGKVINVNFCPFILF
jgi:hypothetical protein